MPTGVKIEGLDQVRKQLKEAKKEFVKELKKVSKEGAELVVPDAKSNAPVDTGKLQGVIRAGATTKGGFIEAKLIYAPIIEYGGYGNRKSTPFMEDAIEGNVEKLEQHLEKSIQALLDRTFGKG